MKKILAVLLALVMATALSLSCASASSPVTLPTMCSLHDFSNRFTLASFIYNTDHEFLSENMESTAGDIKNCITTYFPSANAYVNIYMPVGTKDICEIAIHNYGGNTHSNSMNLILLVYEIIMAAGNFSTSQEVSACMDALGMLDDVGTVDTGTVDYQGLHLYWLMSDFLGFVFCVSPA